MSTSDPHHPDWVGLDRRHVWHPYTQMATAAPPVPIARASGAYLHTVDGRAILDAISSWWVTLHGHADARIAAVIGDQARTLEHVIFAGFTHEPAARLSENLVRLAPDGLERVFFSDNGSTAVEVALKMAYQYWRNLGEEKRQVFVAVEASYHGDTVGAMSVGGIDVFHGMFGSLLFEVHRVANPFLDTGSDEIDTRNRAAIFASSLEACLERLSGRVAALILEPMIQGAGGMVLWPSETLLAAREICNRHGVLLIADEVFTGFGRTGPMFSCAHAAITPDILCLSKALTGGTLPLAATLATEAVYRAFLGEDRRRTFFHGHSYTANPIACAAAIESLAILEDSGLSRVHEIEEIHRQRLPGLRALPSIHGAGHLGLIARMEVAGNPVTDDRTGYLDALGPRLREEFLRRNVLLRPLGNVVYILPPLAMTDEDLHRVYDTIEDVLALVANDTPRRASP